MTVGGSGNSVDLLGVTTGGTGTLSGANASLEFGGATSDNILFNDAVGRLVLDSASSFAGTVAGMASGDSIDMKNFLFSGAAIGSVTGSGAAGTTTDITLTDGGVTAMVALLNQYANQFAVNSSAYTLTADGTAGSSAGTLLQLAAAH